MPNPPLTTPASRRVTVGALLAILLALLAALGPAEPAHAGEADDLHALANSSRASAGLAPLTRNPVMDAVAAAWAAQLAVLGSLAHNPSYSAQIPGGWVRAGENVAQGQPTAAAMHDAWMTSAGHRANILGDYTDVGIAFVAAGGTTWGVQVFAAYPGSVAPPPTASAPPDAAPTPAPETSGGAAPDGDAPRGTTSTPAPGASTSPEAEVDEPEAVDTELGTIAAPHPQRLRSTAPAQGALEAAGAITPEPGGWMWVPFGGAALLAAGGGVALLLRRRGLIGPAGGRHLAER